MYTQLFELQTKVYTFVYKFINTMIVSNYKMTGNELKRIYSVSELDGNKFAEMLGIIKGEPFNRNKLYTQFARGTKEVDMEVSEALKKNPELAKYQQLLTIGQANNDTPKEQTMPGFELWMKTIEMLQETLMLIRDDNTFIKEDARIYRSMVEKGIKEGAISFGKLSKKGA